MEVEEETQQILKVLESLKQASQQLQSNPEPDTSESDSSSSSSSAIKALLDLDTESDPNLSNLSHHLTDLKILISSLQKSKNKHGSIKSFLTRRSKTHEITRVAESIESEIQGLIDRESITNLTLHLQQIRTSRNSLESVSVVDKLSLLRNRLSQGFDINLQDLMLKSEIFSELEFLLCNRTVSQTVRERAGYALKEVVLFNKDVFVGQVLMGEMIKGLISLDSLCSLEILISLIKAIRSPLVDVIESVGGISKTISYLDSEDLAMKVMAMNCILEIGYFGRKEAIEAMMNCGLIKKLVELQRSKLGGDLIDLGKAQQKIDEDEDEDEDDDEDEEEGGVDLNNNNNKTKTKTKKKKKKRGYGEKRYMERHPFASCVARFGVQLEVGEGLRQREKRGFKQEILNKIREACDTDAEAATIVAEVLWGSSP